MQRYQIVDRRMRGDDGVLRANGPFALGFDDDRAVLFFNGHDRRVREQLPAALLDAADQALEVFGRMEGRLVWIAQAARALVTLERNALRVVHRHSSRLRGFIFFLDFRLLGPRPGKEKASDAPESAVDAFRSLDTLDAGNRGPLAHG